MSRNVQSSGTQAGTSGKKKQVPVEQKMKLAQYIREENLDNRLKIRAREKILYGTDTMPPLWTKGEPPRKEAYLMRAEGNPQEDIPQDTGTFKLRMAAAVLLFIGFLLCDAGQYEVFGYSMNDIHAMISDDYFKIYDAGTQLSGIKEGITQLW
ncbi:MAG: hypothetical protein NC434_06385 [Ruminococcus sp.]|nr:hypothetical protein [Ruminococcus sp.]MCM1155674.1 hypothetical protein [Roseburia sp.]